MRQSDVDLSKLSALISGGEAIPTTTAVAVADLLCMHGASRGTLRAAFGMSETGGGCTYNLSPIPPEWVPELPSYLAVGACCPGVSFRVVDGNGEVVQSGKTGYLQLKGSSVFKGYHNNPIANRESFTPDGWFITGDLVEVDGSAYLRLVGREKDFININGVKHLSLDLQQYVQDQNVDGVAFGQLLVCPLRFERADTETYGIFYQHEIAVEDEEAFEANRKRIRNSNRQVKQACATFLSQAPHVVLPVPRGYLVKTALGKVSQSALSRAYMNGEFRHIEDVLADRPEDIETLETALKSHVELMVAAEVGEIFRINPQSIRRSHNLFDLGASSMHLLRLKSTLQDMLKLEDLPTIDILQRPYIGDLCDYLDRRSNDNTMSSAGCYEPVICFNASGTKPPLFLIHPGVGEVLVFIGLARRLAEKDDRPVYAIRARGFDQGEEPFALFDEMVQCYVNAIERTCAEGPYYIAGYSFGGALAFSIAKQLREKGKKVDWLGVLNLPPHIKFRLQELTWAEILLHLMIFLSLIKQEELDYTRQILFDEFPHVAVMDDAPPEPEKPITWLFERSDAERLRELDLKLPAFVQWVGVAYSINRTGRTFEPEGCVDGALTTVFCAIPLPSMGSREQYKNDRLEKWREFSERCELIDVDGEHYTMLSEPHVDGFAEKMKDAMERAVT